MPDPQHNLAIETSGRHGSVALGRGDELLACVDLPEQRRHAVELMPAIERLFAERGLTPADLAAVYVSIGPGSFTGLRIAVTTAKVLGLTVGARLVAVPTLEVVAHNAPADRPHVAVCLSAKRGESYTGLFDRSGEAWVSRGEPAVLDVEGLLSIAPRPLAIIADKPPAYDWPGDVAVLDAALAVAKAEHVWRLGRRLAAAGAWVSAEALVPRYVRLPEAEEVWRRRQAGADGG